MKKDRNLHNLDQWKKFELTGRVSDYLKYKSDSDLWNEMSIELSDLDECVEQQGAESRARVFNGDGNDIEADAGGRI